MGDVRTEHFYYLTKEEWQKEKRKTLAYWLAPFFNIRVSNADAATLSGFDLSRTRQMLLSGIFSLTLTWKTSPLASTFAARFLGTKPRPISCATMGKIWSVVAASTDGSKTVPLA